MCNWTACIGGGLIAAMRHDFVALDFSAREISPAANFRLELRGDRFNDGKCDRQGHFWVGSMDDAETKPNGDFFRLGPGGSVQRFPAGFVVTNGIGWSPDDQTMYITDSAGRTIYACDYDPRAGIMGPRRVFARVATDAGYPDGLTVDADGRVWSAHWDGWRVTCYTPGGRVEREITLPVQRPTSCTFGGAALDTLYITSARVGLDDTALAKGPQAGAMFAIQDAGVKGIEEPAYLG